MWKRKQISVQDVVVAYKITVDKISAFAYSDYVKVFEIEII